VRDTHEGDASRRYCSSCDEAMATARPFKA
jgi:hypothetical protein